MKFEYIKPKATVEAYGQTFEIPTKTIAVVDGINNAHKEIAETRGDAAKQVKAIKKGIAVFIGEEATEKLFPTNKEAEIDTDELSMFWLCLNRESNKLTQTLVDKYSDIKSHAPVPIKK